VRLRPGRGRHRRKKRGVTGGFRRAKGNFQELGGKKWDKFQEKRGFGVFEEREWRLLKEKPHRHGGNWGGGQEKAPKKKEKRRTSSPQQRAKRKETGFQEGSRENDGRGGEKKK